MRPPVFVHPLSDEEREALESRYRQTRDADERTRCQIVLLSHQGMKAQEIASIVLKSSDTVRRTIRRYEAEGLAGLRDRRHDHKGAPRKVTPDWEAALLHAVEQDPRSLGVNRANWTASLLADYLAQKTGIRVGEERVRHYLRVHRYASLRPTWTVAHLARQDPEYEEKKRALEALLSQPPEDADLYVQDEVQMALHPTLTRTWMKRGRGCQRKIKAPGSNQKRHLFGATDWRAGEVVRRYADHQDSETFCALVDGCVARSKSRGRRAILIVDCARIHTPEGAKAVRRLLERHGDALDLVYLPRYSPDLQPQEWLWRVWRTRVTHNHQRTNLADLEADSEACFAEWDANPQAVLRIIGSPFASGLPS